MHISLNARSKRPVIPNFVLEDAEDRRLSPACSPDAPSRVIMRYHGMWPGLIPQREVLSSWSPLCSFSLESSSPRRILLHLLFCVNVCFFTLILLLSQPPLSPFSAILHLCRFPAAKGLLRLSSPDFKGAWLARDCFLAYVELNILLHLTSCLSVACVSFRLALPCPAYFPFASRCAPSHFSAPPSDHPLLRSDYPRRLSQAFSFSLGAFTAIPCAVASLLCRFMYPRTLHSSQILFHFQCYLLYVYAICRLPEVYIVACSFSDRRQSAASAKQSCHQDKQKENTCSDGTPSTLFVSSFLFPCLLSSWLRCIFSSAAATASATALYLSATARAGFLLCAVLLPGGFLLFRVALPIARCRFTVSACITSLSTCRKGRVCSHFAPVNRSYAYAAASEAASPAAIASHIVPSLEFRGPVTSAASANSVVPPLAVAHLQCAAPGTGDLRCDAAKGPSKRVGTPRASSCVSVEHFPASCAVATDVPGVSAPHLRLDGAAEPSTNCRQKRRRRQWRLKLFLNYSRVLLTLCNLLITALFASTGAFGGCGATWGPTISSCHCKFPLAPKHHFYRFRSSFYDTSCSVFFYPPGTSVSAHACSRTCTRHLDSFDDLPVCYSSEYPSFVSSLPLWCTSPGCRQLSVSSVSVHLSMYKDKSFISLSTLFAFSLKYSPDFARCAFVPASSRRIRDVLPSSRSGNGSTRYILRSGSVPSFHSYPDVYVPHPAIPLTVTSSLRAIRGAPDASPLCFAKHLHISPPSSPFCSTVKVPFRSTCLPCLSFTVYQSLFAASRSPWPYVRRPSGDISSVVGNILQLSLSAVGRHGYRSAGAQTTGDSHQDSKEEENLLSRLHPPSSEDAEAAVLQQAGHIPVEQHYHSVGPPEDESEGQSQELFATTQQKASRFGSLTDPGEPPTPPPVSPFWPSYPPKKISPLPGGRLPRWHPRSPFPPLQPRGPLYQQLKDQETKERPLKAEKKKQTEGNVKAPATCVGLPEKPPDLPKNYKHWVRDSRYTHPQFTTLTASLKYRRRLKRSSRKLDWRLKNVHFRRMYFAWRRNMRDQELHRWMREKIRWSKSTAEYWKREYSRQQEEWLKQRPDPKELVPAQKPEENSADAQTPPAGKVQSRRGQRGEASANVSVVPEYAERASLGEAYAQPKREGKLAEDNETDRLAKAGPPSIVAKPPTRRSVNRPLAAACQREVDGEASTTTRESDDRLLRPAGTKIVREEEENEKEEDDECRRATKRPEGQTHDGEELRTTLRDLTSQVMSSLSPEEIRDIAVNGYRLPPMTAAIASSPIPWWASRKGEHKWRGKNVAANVQSRWVNWANPRRRIEAVVGSCLLPREGGILEKLKKEGEKLKQAMERVEKGGEVAGAYRHPKSKASLKSLEQEQSLNRWSADEHPLDQGLRELWKQKKLQKGKEGGRQEGDSGEGDLEDDKRQLDAVLDADICTGIENRRLPGDTGEGCGSPEGAGDEEKVTRKTQDSERTTARQLGEEEEEEKSLSSHRARLEGTCEQSTRIKEKRRSSPLLRTSTDAAQRESMGLSGREDTRPNLLEERQTAGPPEEGSGSPEKFPRSPLSVARSGAERSAPLRGTDTSVLDMEEKQRKAIEAAIEVSLMLGHSTIVKTQGSVVPYDVHSPFMRSHTSSRRRRMRLRGREKGPEKRSMTRQERRLANRDARFKEAEKRKDEAKAARRRAWEERQRGQTNNAQSLSRTSPQ